MACSQLCNHFLLPRYLLGQYYWSVLSEYKFVQFDSELFTFTTRYTNMEEISWQIRNMRIELDIIWNEFKSWWLIFLRSAFIGHQYFWCITFYESPFLFYVRVIFLCSFNAFPSLHHNSCHSTCISHYSIFPIKNHPLKIVVLSLSFKCNAIFFFFFWMLHKKAKYLFLGYQIMIFPNLIRTYHWALF